MATNVDGSCHLNMRPPADSAAKVLVVAVGLRPSSLGVPGM